ncbi:MAG: F0F1 ATP synthase subunit B [Magnetococcales bacterium]|nr:F0F1 ATP synthase subunit B [Magnetococcales bacterium]
MMIPIAQITSAAGVGGGLPQFDTSTFASQGFWTVVSFVILMFLMVKHVIPAINDILDARSKSIEGEIGKAKNMREDAEKTLADYRKKLKAASQEATQTIESARQDANRQREESLAEVDKEIAKKRDSATEQIELAKRQAMEEIQTMAVDIAMLATEKLIAKSVTKTDANKMVTEAITELKDQDINLH